MSFDARSTERSETRLAWFRTKRRVAWSDCDPADMYTFLSALRYVEDAEVGMLRSYGLLKFFYPHLPRIYLEVSYKEPARFDDEITTSLAIMRLGKSSLHFVFQISREAVICAEGRYGVCYLGQSGKPTPIPGDVCRVLLPN